ncbi:MAG: TlpA disulfide reductase family protein, partial [Sphingomonadales bacterium]
VNFWATWCEPCKEEMPTLQNLEAKLGGDNFQVVTISVDWQGFEIMDPFFEEFKVQNLIPYWDNSGRLPNELEVIGLPLTILLDADGNWMGRMDGPLVWDSIDALNLFKAASQKN